MNSRTFGTGITGNFVQMSYPTFRTQVNKLHKWIIYFKVTRMYQFESNINDKYFKLTKCETLNYVVISTLMLQLTGKHYWHTHNIIDTHTGLCVLLKYPQSFNLKDNTWVQLHNKTNVIIKLHMCSASYIQD